MTARSFTRWGLSVVAAVAGMFLALVLTPDVSVSTLGQTIQVGAVHPPAAFSWAGTGEVDLFGEGAVSTVQRFDSFIRPLIVWRKFDASRAASEFIQSEPRSTGGAPGATVGRIGQSLASGWSEYLVQLALLAALLGAALHLVVLGGSVLVRRLRRVTPRRPMAWVASTAALSLVVTVTLAGVTVVSAYRQLHGVSSLADLVGTVQLAPASPAPGPARTGVTIVVIGDSTAAGDGNAPVRHPTKQDTACDRSRDSYASDLQAVTGSRVLNLSCSSATIAHGLLGPQSTHGLTVLPQLSALEAVAGESAIVVSTGANDIGWQDFVYYCAVAQQCDDRATARLFQSRLDRFKIQYAQLLLRLAALPGHPLVVINQYYDPFGGAVGCLQTDQTRSPTESPPLPGAPGATSPGNGNLLARARTLSSEIAQLNAVLVQGAHAFHDVVVRPDFAGHTLCTGQPWVQGTTAPAPFHPNAAGELAIAAADLPHLIGATGVVQTSPR